VSDHQRCNWHCFQMVVLGTMRPSKVIAKAFRAGSGPPGGSDLWEIIRWRYRTAGRQRFV
jgi:hypothetical protein